MVQTVYNLILSAAKIRSHSGYPSRMAVFTTYLRMRFTEAWLKLRGIHRTHTKILGFKVECFDYSTLVYLFEEIFVQGTYVFEARAAQPVVLDAGSNIGISVLFIKWLYPEARIIAFEPDPATFALLRKNIEGNQLKNVELHNVALSVEEGQATFHSAQAGSLIASLLRERSLKAETQTVNTRNLGGFLETPIDFMKMDIEGGESECLTDLASRGLLSRIGEMVIECHHNLPGKENILTQVLPVLENGGYRYQIRNSTSVPRQRTSAPQDVVIHVFKEGLEN